MIAQSRSCNIEKKLYNYTFDPIRFLCHSAELTRRGQSHDWKVAELLPERGKRGSQARLMEWALAGLNHDLGNPVIHRIEYIRSSDLTTKKIKSSLTVAMRPLRPFNLPTLANTRQCMRAKSFDVALYFLTAIFQTVKVQGNDISHKLQISKVRKKDEGLYECRVTDANYGELQEHKAQAYLKVNANSHARRMQAFEASPMWLQDMKPRKNVSAAIPSSIHSSVNQQMYPTSSPQAVAKIPKQSPQSGMETHFELFILPLTTPPQEDQSSRVDRCMYDVF